MKIDQEKLDEVVLALLWFNSYTEKVGKIKVARAWKSMDWDVLNRLHEKELISDPKSKAKSVVIYAEELEKAENLFIKHFCIPSTD